MAGIFDHILDRSLAHVTRFNSFPQHFQESVAEHSFFVAYIVTILIQLLEKQGVEVDKAKAVSMALVHDIEEKFSGDILSPFKHYSQEITSTVRKVNQEIIKQSFEGLPESLAAHYIALWTEDSEGESRESQIVKTADKLSLISKCAEEVKVGNEFFQQIYEDQVRGLREYDVEWWQKIKEQVLPISQ